MDCRDIRRFLDEANFRPESPVERESLNQHLRDCLACREEWNATQMLASLSIPGTPEGLLERIVKAIDRFVMGNVIPFPVRRTVIITSIVLIGSAAATLMLVDRNGTETADIASSLESEEAVTSADQVPVEQEALNSQGTLENEPGEPGDATFEDAPDEVAADASGQITLDPSAVLVLPVDNRTLDQDLSELAAAYRDELERRLIADTALNVVDAGLVPTYRINGLNDTEIARSLGARTIVAIETENASRNGNTSISTQLFDAQTENYFSNANTSADLIRSQLNSSDPVPQTMSIFRSIQTIHQYMLGEPVQRLGGEREPAALLETIYDQNANPMARGSALMTLNSIAQSGGAVTTADVAEAARTLATNATFPFELERAWQVLRAIEAPTNLAPLALAELSSQSNERVRLEIIRFLRAHSELPYVRDALASVVASDQSLAVRREAELAMLSEDDRLQYRRDRFLDTSLTVEERLEILAPLTEDQPAIDSGIGLALIDIAANAEDEAHRQTALLPLSGVDLPSLIDPLLGLINLDYPAGIRESAIVALREHADEPRVRAALADVAENDPNGSVRFMATITLDPTPQD